MEQIVIYLLMVQKLVDLKKQIGKLQQHHIQEKFQKNCSVDNMSGFKGYIYHHFSRDYDYIAVDDILDIHKYLMRKNIIA